MKEEIIIFSDGGARGNPGPAGIGFTLERKGKRYKSGKFIGEDRTNNEAEYEALVNALKKAKSLFGKSVAKKSKVISHSDSELLVRQLNHQYKIKEKRIQKLFIEIWNLTVDFASVEFIHIPREKNTEADRLANEAMDQEQSRLI